MPRRSTWFFGLAMALPLVVGLVGCRSSGTGSAASLTGTVTDAMTAQPIAGAEVALGNGTAQADSSTSIQGSASITLDPAQTAHGVYARANGSTTEVVYATQTGSSWRAEVVGTGEVWSNHVLAFDISGNPHLVFVSPYSASTRYVWYAH